MWQVCEPVWVEVTGAGWSFVTLTQPTPMTWAWWGWVGSASQPAAMSHHRTQQQSTKANPAHPQPLNHMFWPPMTTHHVFSTSTTHFWPPPPIFKPPPHIFNLQPHILSSHNHQPHVSNPSINLHHAFTTPSTHLWPPASAYDLQHMFTTLSTHSRAPTTYFPPQDMCMCVSFVFLIFFFFPFTPQDMQCVSVVYFILISLFTIY